jgi:hypothetical protein
MFLEQARSVPPSLSRRPISPSATRASPQAGWRGEAVETEARRAPEAVAAEASQRCVEQRTVEAACRSERVGGRRRPLAWVGARALEPSWARA